MTPTETLYVAPDILTIKCRKLEIAKIMLPFLLAFVIVMLGMPSLIQLAMQKNLLDFMVDDIKKVNREIPGSEKAKLGAYLNAFEELQIRHSRLASMKGSIRSNAPEFSDKFTSEVEEVRQEAHFDLASAALIAEIVGGASIPSFCLRHRCKGNRSNSTKCDRSGEFDDVVHWFEWIVRVIPSDKHTIAAFASAHLPHSGDLFSRPSPPSG